MRCAPLFDCDHRPEIGRKTPNAMKKILFRALLCAAAGLLYAQPACAQHSLTFSVDQPESPLTVDAGEDLNYDGSTDLILGGMPTATGGYGDYTFQWEPAEFLDDPTAPNPSVIGLDAPTTFTLTVSDPGALCTKQSQVFVDFALGTADESAPEVIAFPNPFTDAVTFKSNAQIQTLTVTDMTGKIIAQEGIVSAKNFRFETGTMAPGLYLFNIRFTDGSTIAKKLCKIH